MSRLNKFYMSEEQHMDRGESILTPKIEWMIDELNNWKHIQYKRIFQNIMEINAVVSWYDADSDLKSWGLLIERIRETGVSLISEDDISFYIDYDSIVSINTTGEIITKTQEF